MSNWFDYEEEYRGLRITVVNATPRARVPAVITGHNCSHHGAGIGTDLESAIVSAKIKIDNIRKVHPKKFWIKH